jgi:CO/xanthine dehydrogenase FAD-binding subunit
MVPLSQFILGNRRTARRPDQIVTGLHIPVVSSRGRSAFYKLGARRYLVISIAMAACVLDADEAGAITRAAVSVGACSEVARRLPELEADLVGRIISPELAGFVEPRHAAGLAPIDDVRGSAEYRSEAAVEVLRLMFGRLGSSN